MAPFSESIWYVYMFYIKKQVFKTSAGSNFFFFFTNGTASNTAKIYIFRVS